VCCEEAVHESNLVSNEKSESDADQSGSDGQTAVEVRKLAGVCEGNTKQHRNHHHAGDGSQSENKQVSNSPTWVADRGQHQKCDRGGSGKAVHYANRQRTNQLVQSQALERLLQGALRFFFQAEMNIRVVRMCMDVGLAAVPMNMRVYDCGVVFRRESFGDPACDAGQIHHAEQDEHQSDRKFHGQTDAGWDGEVENDDSGAYQHDRDRVPQPPESSDQSGMPDALLTAHDGRDRDHVVRVGRVPDPQHESHADDCQQAEHSFGAGSCIVEKA